MSKIIKSSFVEMSQLRKEIKTVDPNDPNVITSSLGSHKTEIEEETPSEAINDPVIDGSVSIQIEALMDEAKAEAEALIEQAAIEAEKMKETARQQGFDMGYSEGQESLEEVLAQNEKAFLERSAELEASYNRKVEELSPKVAAVIIDLMDTLVGDIRHEDEVIKYLVKLALKEIHGIGHFTVKVSPVDFPIVMASYEEISSGLSDKIHLEILKDSDMTVNQCLIISEFGNLDASLSVRVEGLMRELKLIADSMRQ